MHSVVYPGNNSQRVELAGLRDHAGAFISDAAVRMTALRERGGDAVAITLPIVLEYVEGSNGEYVGQLPTPSPFQAGRWYIATVEAVSNGRAIEVVELLRGTARRA